MAQSEDLVGGILVKGLFLRCEQGYGSYGSGEAADTSPGGKRVSPLNLEGQMCCQRHLSADPNQGAKQGLLKHDEKESE